MRKPKPTTTRTATSPTPTKPTKPGKAGETGATTRGRPGRAGAGTDWKVQANKLAARALVRAGKLPGPVPRDDTTWRRELAEHLAEPARRAARQEVKRLAHEALRLAPRGGGRPAQQAVVDQAIQRDLAAGGRAMDVAVRRLQTAVASVEPLPQRDAVIAALLSRVRPRPKLGARPIAIFEAFSGGGLLGVGVEQAIIEAGCAPLHAGFCELNPNAARAYKINFGEDIRRYPDITRIADGTLGAPPTRREQRFLRRLHAKADEIDVLVGGPPCQAYSKVRGHVKVTEEEIRTKVRLYTSMVRLTEVIKPRIVLIENVREAKYNAIVKAAIIHLGGSGYRVSTATINAADLGTPQHRQRFLVIGVREDVAKTPLDFKILRRIYETEHHAVREVLDDLREDPSRAETIGGGKRGKVGIRTRFTAANPGHLMPMVLRSKSMRKQVELWGDIFRRMDAFEPSPPLTRNLGSPQHGQFLHPYETRGLSPREGLRIQGVPDWYRLPPRARSHWYLLAGNGAPPQLGNAVIGTAFRQGLLRTLVRASDGSAEDLCRAVMAAARVNHSFREIKAQAKLGGKTLDQLARGTGLRAWRAVGGLLASVGLCVVVDPNTPARSPRDLAADIQSNLRQRLVSSRKIRNAAHLSHQTVERWLSSTPADLADNLGPLARVAHVFGVGIAVVPAR